MELHTYLKVRREQIEFCLQHLLNSLSLPAKRLQEAASYSLLFGGKRLRPLLTLATAETLGADPQDALYPACAIEWIHTYSLIHDDLPCMDDDDFRRNRKTLHKTFDEATALLTGDFLLTHAFAILAQSPRLTSDKISRLVAVIATCAGGDGMISGQLLDLQAQGLPIELSALQTIHRLKTGALLSAAIECGGIVAGADSTTMEQLRSFGYKVGLAFQIVDDILDVTSGMEKKGKMGGSDAAKDKPTYASCMGIEKAKLTADALLEESLDQIRSIGQSPILQEIATLLVHRST